MKRKLLILAIAVTMIGIAFVSCDKNAGISSSGNGIVINEDGSFDLTGTKWCGLNTYMVSSCGYYDKLVERDTILFLEGNRFLYYGTTIRMDWDEQYGGTNIDTTSFDSQGHYVNDGKLIDLVMEQYTSHNRWGDTNYPEAINGHLHIENGKIESICIGISQLYRFN